MRTPTGIRRRTGIFRARTGTALAALVLLGSAGTAVAADPSAGPSPAAASTATATAAPSGQPAGGTTQAERLAEELRKNPVYVSAAEPRRLPRSLAPEIAALAERTGVPTYVLALPDGDAALLALVHDRLGADGLYVVISGYGLITATAFGVDVPVDEARRVSLYGTPYRAGPLAGFENFVDAVASGKDRAAAKAEEVYGRYRDSDRPSAYISATDRQNQNLLLGLAVVVIPGLVLALGLRLSLRRTRSSGADPARKTGRKAGPKTGLKSGRKPAVSLDKGPEVVPPAARTPGAGWRLRGLLPVTLLATAAAVFGVVHYAPTAFPQVIDSPYLNVTQADLNARVDEIATGLTADPVYQDPSGPDALTAADLPAIRQRLTELAPKGPVHIVVTSADSDGETRSDRDLLLALIHERTGRNGVYILVDQLTGVIGLDSYGTGQDTLHRFARVPTDVKYARGETKGLNVAPRLNQVLDAVAAAEPKPGYDPAERDTTLPPLHDNRLPALFSNDFGGGIALGVMLLGVLLLLAWAALATARAVLRSRRARAAGSSQQHAKPRHTGPLPSLRHLRARAGEGVRELAARLAAADQDAPGRTRAWDCLDAAGLLADSNGQHPDGSAEAGDLAAVVVLAEAGLAALRGHLHPTLCRLDPLHGEATGGRVPAWFAELGIGPRSAQLCPTCRDALRSGGADQAARAGLARDRLLRLPGADDRTRTAWDEAGQILPAAREGLEALILRARESASVQ
ncbi:hypothetical protein ACIQOW_09680 [Kitasatospora sp. NPDC091335]|uniref:hypothetical protein n=1 Tax=Kitasatospora sp. NPDC091335 TaxID=3364085 RepID=UPI0037FF2296